MGSYISKGQAFNMWTAVDDANWSSRTTRGATTYNKIRCRCECGTERLVSVASLLKASTFSCGCTRTFRAVKAGERYGSWTVLSDGRGTRTRVSCRCICGTERQVKLQDLIDSYSKSCGCVNRAHIPVHTPVYNAWNNMIQRCLNSRNPQYPTYGERGITVCERWQGKEGAANFAADMGERPPGLTLERIDNERGYSPDNCQWASWDDQHQNRRPVQSNSTVLRLKAEVGELRTENAALQAQNDQLRRRVNELIGMVSVIRTGVSNA